MPRTVNTKSLERAQKNLAIAQSRANLAHKLVFKLMAKLKRDRLRAAIRNAKFRIGDIINCEDYDAPILIIAVEASEYSRIYPIYRGLQICKDHLTRRVRITWNDKAVKVGDCESLHVPPGFIKYSR